MTVSDADGGGMSASFGGAASARDECDGEAGDLGVRDWLAGATWCRSLHPLGRCGGGVVGRCGGGAVGLRPAGAPTVACRRVVACGAFGR